MTTTSIPRIDIVSASIVPTRVWAGANSEMADMDNPRGDFYEERFTIEVLTASGRRFNHQDTFENRPEGLLGRVRAAMSIALDHWVEGYEVYGSAAWQDGDQQREMAWQADPATRGSIRDF